MSDRVLILPLWIRLWHWSNAVLMIVLTITGISLHFADPESTWLVPFEISARVHIVAGLALAILYGFFVIANAWSGNWWQYVPKPQGWRDRVGKQMRFYFRGIFHGEPHPYPPTPQANFNSLQQLVYWIVMYLFMPILVVTGLIFTWPDLAPRRVFGMDGLVSVAVIHYLAGLVIVLFMLSHIYLATTGERVGSLVRMMITGWHEHEKR
ncbi:cytochrome b/b6 domain-containing protein [Thiocapsa sp. UBA6158]|jgi:thiosulfate reductase cytochrome b subunit|uniref:cytochrome b/b6 domain-containing protein n=1 Tax=Thiocapsa sp. UBA6158 TaxID=1947692 RepID=UPI0025F77802|nr:cytochrome b/b6 domain-containing protein [Thiocapsa sp. UBA6158]